MKNKKDFWVIGIVLLVAVAFLMPAMAQAKTKQTKAERLKKEREKLVAELKLSPDKAKEFMAVGDKFDQQRKEIKANIKKNEADLKQAMAASPPDEGKVKSLVDEAVSNQEKFFDTFKEQSKEELALMTPMQQGKYVLTLLKLHGIQSGKMKKKK
jgi:hypothetical protein